MIDYHIHTRLCNHARGSMEAYIKKGIQEGLKEICFLDHLTIQDEGKGLSMLPSEVPLYFQALQYFKNSYNGLIDIKAGLEVDFNPVHAQLFEDIINTYAFDLITGSLHFPGGIDIVSRSSAWSKGQQDNDYIYSLYFKHLEEMLGYDYFDVIGHIDLIKKFGKKPLKLYDKEINKILSIIKKKCLVVEVNTSGYNHPAGEAYPCSKLLKKCNRAGIGITLGSDAHKPEQVGQYFDRALSMLISAGYTEITTFTKRLPKKISINIS